MLGVTSSPTVTEEMKRSMANGEEAPQAKRKKVQAEDLDSTLVRLQTVAQDQESVIERPQSTQVEESIKQGVGRHFISLLLYTVGVDIRLRSLPVFRCDFR